MEFKNQLGIIFLVVTGFALFNYAIYSLFTYRYIDRSSQLMKEKSIELNHYLPFDDESRIVQLKSDTQLNGNLPVLDGATALFPIYSSFMNATYPSGSVDFDGTDFTSGSLLQKTGTRGAYEAIINGNADIIFVAQPSKEQEQYAEALGAQLVYIPIGYEAFVFIVNAQNPVDSLTIEQVRGIYSGQYDNWRQLGGADAQIIPLQRIENSGSQTAMIDFMEDKPFMDNRVQLFGKAIGYSFRFYVSDISAKDNVKMLSLNNIYPSRENICNGTYPLTDCFYAVYRADDTNENIRLFIDWILSDEGQFIVNETGYVGIR